MSAPIKVQKKKLSNSVCIWKIHDDEQRINPLNAKLNPICHLLELVGAHPIFYVSRIRVKLVGSSTSLLCFITHVQYVRDN
jgi:hypothetical protein